MEIAADTEKVIDSVTENIISIKDYYRDTLADMDDMSKEINSSAEGFFSKNKEAAQSIASMLSEV